MPTYSSSGLRTSLTRFQIGTSFGYDPALSQSIAITSAARTSNVVTVVTATVYPFPVGASVVIAGTSPAGATSFNGTFTIVAATNGTHFTFAQTAADDTATGGTVVGTTVYEPMPVINTAGTAFAVPDSPYGSDNNGRTVTWGYGVVTAPGAITVALQGAPVDVEASYVTLDSATVVGGTQKVATSVNNPFLRLKITALTLTNGVGLTGFIQV